MNDLKDSNYIFYNAINVIKTKLIAASAALVINRVRVIGRKGQWHFRLLLGGGGESELRVILSLRGVLRPQDGPLFFQRSKN